MSKFQNHHYNQQPQLLLQRFQSHYEKLPQQKLEHLSVSGNLEASYSKSSFQGATNTQLQGGAGQPSWETKLVPQVDKKGEQMKEYNNVKEKENENVDIQEILNNTPQLMMQKQFNFQHRTNPTIEQQKLQDGYKTIQDQLMIQQDVQQANKSATCHFPYRFVCNNDGFVSLQRKNTNLQTEL